MIRRIAFVWGLLIHLSKMQLLMKNMVQLLNSSFFIANPDLFVISLLFTFIESTLLELLIILKQPIIFHNSICKTHPMSSKAHVDSIFESLDNLQVEGGVVLSCFSLCDSVAAAQSKVCI